MLDASRNTLILHSLYITHRHLGDQERILALVLEIPTIERSSHNIDSGSQDDILTAVIRFTPQYRPECIAQFGIPGGSQTDTRRQIGAGIQYLFGLHPIPALLRPYPMRTI